MPILQIHRGSHVALGNGLSLRSTKASNPLTPRGPVVLSTRSKNARLVIGDDCGLTGVVVVAEEEVIIGARVLIGANTIIADTDFHPLNHQQRALTPTAGKHAPIRIEDDVFIGTQAIILKGVRLGPGCVVGAGSVVSRDVPAGAVVAGNPARVVGNVESPATAGVL